MLPRVAIFNEGFVSVTVSVTVSVSVYRIRFCLQGLFPGSCFPLPSCDFIILHYFSKKVNRFSKKFLKKLRFVKIRQSNTFLYVCCWCKITTKVCFYSKGLHPVSVLLDCEILINTRRFTSLVSISLLLQRNAGKEIGFRHFQCEFTIFPQSSNNKNRVQHDAAPDEAIALLFILFFL